MNKKELIAALDLIDKWMKKDDELSDAYHAFHKIISPTSYPPVVEMMVIDGVLDALNTIYPKYKEEFSYYTWELPRMNVAPGRSGGKMYDFKNRDEFIEWVLSLDYS